MKQVTILLLLVASIVFSANSQTLTMNTSTKQYGYKNSEGGWQIAPQFQYAYAFQGHFKRFAVVKLDRFWGCIDTRGHLIVRNIFHTMEEAEQAGKEWEKGDEPGKWLYPAENPADGRWGFVDYYGNWKFEPEYEDAVAFVGDEPMSFAAVKSDGRWGCIDRKGVMVIAAVFMSQEHASLAGQQWIYARHYDTWRYPTREKKSGLWGYVNYLGRWVVEAQYEDYDYFGTDHNYLYAQVKKNGRWGSIDRNGNIVSQYIFYTRQDADYALLQKEQGRPIEGWRLPVTDPETGLYGWVDYAGEWVISPIYEDNSRFTNDTGEFATCKIDGYWGSIDKNGELLSHPVFTLSSEAWQAGYEWDNNQELGHWLYPVKQHATGYWGYVNFKGQWVIQPTFEDAKLFIKTWNNRAAPAKMDGRWGCIDHTGQFVVKNIYTTSAEAYEAARRWSEKGKF